MKNNKLDFGSALLVIVVLFILVFSLNYHTNVDEKMCPINETCNN